jgi:hypothetical protein
VPDHIVDKYEYKSIADQQEYLLLWKIEREQAEGWEVVKFYIWEQRLDLNPFRCWMRRNRELANVTANPDRE